MASIEKKYTKIQLDIKRFEKQVVGNLRDIGRNALQIIDRQYNRRYLYKYGTQFNLLIDSLNKKYYVLDTQGKDIDDIHSIIPKLMLDFNLDQFDRDLFLDNDIDVNILYDTFGCFMNNNNKIIQDRLEILNSSLQKKCPDMKLVFDNYYNLKGDLSILFDDKNDTYILCLYYKEKCISSIRLEFINNRFEIYSTGRDYVHNKYNELLRYVIIIICYGFMCNDFQISELVSYPINPILSWLLISNFDTIVYDRNHTILKFNTDTDKEETKKNKLIKTITVPLNESNFIKARILFSKLVDLTGEETIICDKVPTIRHQDDSGCYANPPLKCADPQLNPKYSEVLPDGRYKYAMKIINPQNLEKEQSIAQILYNADNTQEYFIYLIDMCQIVPNQSFINSEKCLGIENKTTGYFFKDGLRSFTFFLRFDRYYGVDKTINSVSYYVGMIIHLLTALKILYDNNLIIIDWDVSIVFDEDKPKFKFINSNYLASLSETCINKLITDHITELKKQESVIDEENIRLLYNTNFAKNPIDKYDNNFSIEGVGKILNLFKTHIDKLEIKFGKCDELEAILNLLQPVNIILDKLTQLKQKLDNPLQQDGGYRAYAKYLKYKSKLKSLH
jgi:hypothetical protein